MGGRAGRSHHATAVLIALLAAFAFVVVVRDRASGKEVHAESGTGPAAVTTSAQAPTVRTPSKAITSSAPGPAAPSAAPTTSAAPTPTQAQAEADVDQVVAGVPDGAASVAALDLTTGSAWSGGDPDPIWTASVYKLLVLEALMIQQNGPLTGSQLDAASTMIENSDNVAGYDLWEAAGGNPGLESAMQALGMTHSDADGSDPAFTSITASDAVLMAKALVTPSVIPSAAQAQAVALMTDVEADQQWGVSAAADVGTTFANKNGWLSIDDDNPAGETDDGRWVVTSVGIVTVRGHQVVLAALSEHNDDFDDGVAVVQALAQDAAAIVTPAAG